MKTEIVLIDLSSIAHPIWHMSQSEPDPNHASQQIAARVRTLANSHPHVAVCCDSGRSFRHDVDATYKANRPEKDAPLHHQIDLAKDALADDGFPVWSATGFEADDLIAAATKQALALSPETTVLVVSADKDLLQLVEPRVRALSPRSGDILDESGVGAKFGVLPSQMRDYLTLVGDASDNIKGAKGIGTKKAGELLAKFESLDALYEQLQARGGGSIGLPPAISAALREFQPQMPVTRQLITLRTDVEFPFDDVLKTRVPKAAQTFSIDEETESAEDAPAAPQSAPPVPFTVESAGKDESPSTAIAVRGDVDLITPAPAEWERQLDPRSMKDARMLAKDMHDSRMFSAYGSPQGVLSTVMVGRELGLPAMASLRCIYNIEGKHSLAASLMVALVLKSGLAEYFEPLEFDVNHATFETKRKGARNPVTLTHTMEMGRQAWPKTKTDWEKAFVASGWGRNPTDMLVARAQSRLARMVYPDLLAGLYTPEELQEIREAMAA